MIKYLFITFLVGSVVSTTLHPVHPDDFAQLFKEPIKAHVSPIGFRPLSGKLEGHIVLANPIGACKPLKEMKN